MEACSKFYFATATATVVVVVVIVVQQQQPGLLKQMAATAGGVAVGSAVVSYSTVHSYLLK